MSSKQVSSVSYVVCVCEVAFSGQRGYPDRTTLTGPGARARALAFAAEEFRRRSASSVEVVRYGGKAPLSGVLLYSQHKTPVCPCNRPDCRSLWSDKRCVVSSPYRRARAPVLGACSVAPACSGNGAWSVASRSTPVASLRRAPSVSGARCVEPAQVSRAARWRALRAA